MPEIFIIIYFSLLSYIAFYGLHLYWLIYIYYKHRNDRHHPAVPASCFPLVTVQLPVYDEKNVVERLINSVASLDWQVDRLEVQVLDDSDDETSEIISATIKSLGNKGDIIEHIQRGGRKGYKAGALQYGLDKANGEFIAIFDADNLPRPDFLKKTIPYFANPRIGMVQARWSFLNRNESLLSRAQALFLDSHFFVEQKARYVGGLFMNFNGTAGIWRKATIIDSGGWRADTLTEDLDLSYRAQIGGWGMVFAEEVDVPTELPLSIRAFKTQQYRWSKGAVETALKSLPKIFRSRLPLRIKLGSFYHLTQKSVSLALLLLSVFLIPALYIRMQGGGLRLLLIDLPIFLLGTGSMSVFYGLAYKRQFKERSIANSLILPALTSLGIALSINNSLAIISALSKHAEAFVRTPKSGTVGIKKIKLPSEYRIRFDNSLKIEILFALYSVSAIICAIILKMYFSIPFLLTFAFGFSYFAYLSVSENYA